MDLSAVKQKLEELHIFHSEITFLDHPTVVGYDKKFKWSWMATQLNTFFLISNFKDQEINIDLLEQHLAQAFDFAKKHYKGWPRGLQSGLGVISVLHSTAITSEAKTYCRKLMSGKKWAGFAIPVVVDSNSKEPYYFEKKPMWGAIYFPYFKKMIVSLTS